MAITKVRGSGVDFDATNTTKGLKMPSGTAFPGSETAVQGMIRNDTNQTSAGASSTMQHYNGLKWKNFVNVTPQATFEVLMAAGGGGIGTGAGAGGGGAGGLLTGSLTVDKGTQISITVGAGGSGDVSQTYATVGLNGGDTVLAISGGTTYTADGGGGGGVNNSTPGSTPTGGSGGGNGGYFGNNSESGQGIATQTNQNGSEGNLTGYGNNGGAQAGVSSPCCYYTGAGGGGAGTAGASSANSPGPYAGAGGDGIISTILSTSDVSTYISASLVDGGNVYFGGGGGGATDSSFTAGAAGKGGGGAGVSGTQTSGNDGIDYSGGGAGASYNTITGNINRGTGGKGVVIIRVLESKKGTAASSGTVESFLASDNNNFRIFIFKDSGTYTV